MAHTVVRRPLNILQFISAEHEQVLVSLANNRDEFSTLSHIHGLYDAATADKNINESDIVIFQMLTFTHYHFLFATACLMRCHLSEAFASVRAAIDGALIGAQLIHDRSSQVAYAKREKPFDNFARYLGNLIKDDKPLPHRLVPDLLSQQKAISGFAVHADVGSFVHRVNITAEPESPMVSVGYFQFAKNPVEREIHGLSVFHSFVMVLDVFSDFLVNELKFVPQEWQHELYGLGMRIDRKVAELRTKLASDVEPTE